MAGEKYADLAIVALAAYLEANLATYLTAVETAQSLDPGSMEEPEAYFRAQAPDDGRAIVEIFCEDGDVGEGDFPRQAGTQQLDAWDVSVILTHHGDADLEAGHQKSYRYGTALTDCLRADPTLGGVVDSAVVRDRSYFAARGSDSPTTYTIALGVEVHTYEP